MTKKVYTVQMVRDRNWNYTGTSAPKAHLTTGTIDELNESFSYTLECGASWQHEEGNAKINRNPRGIKTLIKNLNNAVNNSAANGYAGKTYSEVQG